MGQFQRWYGAHSLTMRRIVMMSNSSEGLQLLSHDSTGISIEYQTTKYKFELHNIILEKIRPNKERQVVMVEHRSVEPQLTYC